MLVLSRHRDESIMIGDDIVITIVDIRGDKVRLGIQAPTHVPVHRQEVYEAIKREGSLRTVEVAVRWLLRSQLGRCDAILANSDSVAEDARGLFGARVPVRTIYNAVDIDRFTPSGPRVDLDALAGLPPLAAGGIRIGLVATFARWKGHAVFLDALVRLRNLRNVRGYIVGDSIYQTDASQFSQGQLRAQAQAHGLGEMVGFTGKVNDVPSVLRSLDIAVHASTEPEPFGLAIAEAMACGVPIVVSRAGGAAEIAQGGALFHEPGNSAQLAERIRELAGDPARRDVLGAQGRETALRLFSRARLRNALMPIYDAIIE